MSSVYSSYIKRMRMCASGNCKGCTYQYEGLTNTEECKEELLYDAAEQLEDADKCNARLVKKCKEMEKQIAELEAQLPKEGKWIDMGDFEMCSVCKIAQRKKYRQYNGGFTWVKDDFCPKCGSRMMKGEQE